MLFIAENLKALRKGKDLTQEEAAEMLGVSPQSVSKWERGDIHAAARVYSKALKLFPNDEGILSELAMALALDGDPEKMNEAELPLILCHRFPHIPPSAVSYYNTLLIEGYQR